MGALWDPVDMGGVDCNVPSADKPHQSLWRYCSAAIISRSIDLRSLLWPRGFIPFPSAVSFFEMSGPFSLILLLIDLLPFKWRHLLKGLHGGEEMMKKKPAQEGRSPVWHQGNKIIHSSVQGSYSQLGIYLKSIQGLHWIFLHFLFWSIVITSWMSVHCPHLLTPASHIWPK